MSLQDMPPDPPAWALEAGLPEPREGEMFSQYVKRIGLDLEPLLAGLTDQTASIANIRLASRLSQAMPLIYDDYVEQLSRRFSTDQDRRRIENIARSLFGSRFRQRRRDHSR